MRDAIFVVDASLPQVLENALAELEKQLGTRTDECDALHLKINEEKNRTNFQAQMLRDEELALSQIEQALLKERQTLHGLDKLIKVQEGQFETDAAKVAERILVLQTQLVEREEEARRVAGELTAERETAAKLKVKIEEVHDLSEVSPLPRRLSGEGVAYNRASEDRAHCREALACWLGCDRMLSRHSGGGTGGVEILYAI